MENGHAHMDEAYNPEQDLAFHGKHWLGMLIFNIQHY